MIKSIQAYHSIKNVVAFLLTGTMAWLLFVYPIAKTAARNYQQLLQIEKQQLPFEENEPDGSTKSSSGKSFNKTFSLEEYLIDTNQRLSLIASPTKDYTAENWEITSLFTGEILVPPPNLI